MTPYISNVTMKTTVMMDYGDLRCIFCHERLPLNKYPYVGRILGCGNCRGFMVVWGHYLGFDNESIHMAVSNLPQKYVEKLNGMLGKGT